MRHMEENGNSRTVEMVSLVDPYVVKTLKTVVGKRLLIETPRGNVQGKLVDVKPDHVVLESNGDATFYVRIPQIIWMMVED